jgi:hypothetical protein
MMKTTHVCHTLEQKQYSSPFHTVMAVYLLYDSCLIVGDRNMLTMCTVSL